MQLQGPSHLQFSNCNSNYINMIVALLQNCGEHVPDKSGIWHSSGADVVCEKLYNIL